MDFAFRPSFHDQNGQTVAKDFGIPAAKIRQVERKAVRVVKSELELGDDSALPRISVRDFLPTE
ncbi:hypothetical protein EVC37_18960 [Methylocaldum sp. BRCS4]|uniref:hypothetical protein n=1 Tax=Methylocaldum sp. 14B TaxID=1912213 RepID=UPI00098AC102|nr:hypothetical protein [Methylocaldum sp. 14B]MVF23676.1 hypothetical protein [Methylocaldum sp. BRCS4]